MSSTKIYKVNISFQDHNVCYFIIIEDSIGFVLWIFNTDIFTN